MIVTSLEASVPVQSIQVKIVVIRAMETLSSPETAKPVESIRQGALNRGLLLLEPITCPLQASVLLGASDTVIIVIRILRMLAHTGAQYPRRHREHVRRGRLRLLLLVREEILVSYLYLLLGAQEILVGMELLDDIEIVIEIVVGHRIWTRGIVRCHLVVGHRTT